MRPGIQPSRTRSPRPRHPRCPSSPGCAWRSRCLTSLPSGVIYPYGALGLDPDRDRARLLGLLEQVLRLRATRPSASVAAPKSPPRETPDHTSSPVLPALCAPLPQATSLRLGCSLCRKPLKSLRVRCKLEGSGEVASGQSSFIPLMDAKDSQHDRACQMIRTPDRPHSVRTDYGSPVARPAAGSCLCSKIISYSSSV